MSNFLSNYSPTGPRINRMGYLKYLVISLVLVFAITVIIGVINNIIGNPESDLNMLIAQIFLFFALVSLGVRRNHDVGISGWWLLAGIIIPIYPIIFCFIPGTKGPNKYGPEPSKK